MKEFFIELFSEELPFRFQDSAKKQFVDLFKTKVQGLVEYDNLESFITPMRMVLKCDLSKFTNESIVEKRGPQVIANQKAIDGFLSANGVDSIDKCDIRNINGKEYYIFKKVIERKNTTEIISEIIEYILQNFKWPKTMQWSSKIRWVRPLRNIFVVFDHLFQKVDLFDIPSENVIHSHKLLGKEFTPVSFDDYKNKLEENYVILDENCRREIIIKDITKLEDVNNFSVLQNEDLITEIVGITEYPTVFISSFEDEFLTLPDEILISFLIHSLKVFPILSSDKKLLNKFVGVANIADTTNPKIGSSKLLNAKLSDAKFFFEKSIKTPILDFYNELKNINFYKDLGTVEDRLQRIAKVAGAISDKFETIDKSKIERISLLAKCDLASPMVFEYPELQGIVGSYVAKNQNEDKDVVVAIKEQYLPECLDDKSPSNKYSIIYSLADKLEYLLSFFNIGIIPSGSSDPLGLKRYATFVLKIFIDNKLVADLSDVIKIAADAIDITEHIDLCTDFIFDKLQNFVNVSKKYLLALVNSSYKYAVCDIIDSAEMLNIQESNDNLEKILNIYKRFSNFATDNEDCCFSSVNKSLLTQYEKSLITEFQILSENNLNGKDRIKFLLDKTNTILNVSEEFFTNVLINDNDESIRKNRIIIATVVKNILDSYLNFSYLY